MKRNFKFDMDVTFNHQMFPLILFVKNLNCKMVQQENVSNISISVTQMREKTLNLES